MIQRKNIIQHLQKKKKKHGKNDILTLHTSLPHHIAQILKWQFVLALFVLCLHRNKNQTCTQKMYMHTN